MVDRDRFGSGDLDVGDAVAVPDRLEERPEVLGFQTGSRAAWANNLGHALWPIGVGKTDLTQSGNDEDSVR